MSELTDDLKKAFEEKGITDEKIMQILLNGFDEIAEIGYHIYNITANQI